MTYVNGNKMSVDTVSEQIIEEAKAKVVSVGTIVPPTYIRPVSGGYVSQNYGNYGHTGTDIVVPSGTAVSAADFRSCYKSFLVCGLWLLCRYKT